MKEKGITLVALVVTIIVLVILASVSINLVIKQNGIWNQAKQAQELSKIGEYKERIDLILTEEVLKNNLENREITITGLIERFEKESFIGSAERIDVEEVETKGTIRLTTTDGYIYEVILDGKNISCISQGKEDGEPYPTITLEQLPMQGIENEKVQIRVTGEVSGGKETTGIAYVERIDNKEKREYQEGGVVFEIEENGTYLFSVTTNKGKSKIGKITINVSQPKDTIAITTTPTTVTNKEVEVAIRYGETEFNNSDKYQYRIGTEGAWKTVTSNIITTTVSENTIIVARYYDGKNSFKVQNYNIQNIDRVAPNAFNYTTSKTINSITITGNTTDTGSAGCANENIGIERYEYSIDDGVTWQTNNNFINLTIKTCNVKMRAIDKAGNVTYGISSVSKTETEPIELIKLDYIKGQYSKSTDIKGESDIKLIKSDFIVTAFYTDGSQSKIEDFTLSQETISGKDNGSLNIQVSYTEREKTVTDSIPFTVLIKTYLIKSNYGTSYNNTPLLGNFYASPHNGVGYSNSKNYGTHYVFSFTNNTVNGEWFTWDANTNIDVTGYKKMYIKYRVYGTTSYIGNGHQVLKVGNWTLIDKWFNVGGNIYTLDTGVVTSSEDISTWNGKQKVYIGAGGCGGYYQVYLYDLWLE